MTTEQTRPRFPRPATRPDAVAWAALRGRVTPRVLIPSDDKTERRMVLLQWLIMPLVLAGALFPAPRPHDPPTHVLAAAALMALHPVLYTLLGYASVARGSPRSRWRDALLTATDVTVATLVFYATAARPGYAQVLLYCAVALAATRYPLYRALGITGLVALLLVFAALLPLKVTLLALAGQIIGLYVLTYLVGLLSEAEQGVSVAAAENARLAQTVLQRNRELNALNQLGRTLDAESNLKELLYLGIAGIADALNLSSVRAYQVENGAPALTERLFGEAAPGEALESRRRAEATRAAAARHSVTKGWRGGDSLQRLAPGPLCVSTPLLVHGEVGAVIQADLPPGLHSTIDDTLESFEVFCGEIAVALEKALLRGEAHRGAILREKNRIAQELHDTVLQMLFSMGLRLQWSLEQLPQGSALREPLEEARHLSAAAGGELRGAIFTLSSDIAEIGLVAAVERLCAEQAAKAGWSANVVVSGTVPELPVLAQNAAHRVVREALMNAYKHARASEVMVSLRFTPGALNVVVQDNGVGITPATLASYRQVSDHFGLRTVAEQIEALGGEFTLYNDDDERGTAVKALIPLLATTAALPSDGAPRARQDITAAGAVHGPRHSSPPGDRRRSQDIVPAKAG